MSDEELRDTGFQVELTDDTSSLKQNSDFIDLDTTTTTSTSTRQPQFNARNNSNNDSESVFSPMAEYYARMNGQESELERIKSGNMNGSSSSSSSSVDGHVNNDDLPFPSIPQIASFGFLAGIPFGFMHAAFRRSQWKLPSTLAGGVACSCCGTLQMLLLQRNNRTLYNQEFERTQATMIGIGSMPIVEKLTVTAFPAKANQMLESAATAGPGSNHNIVNGSTVALIKASWPAVARMSIIYALAVGPLMYLADLYKIAQPVQRSTPQQRMAADRERYQNQQKRQQ